MARQTTVTGINRGRHGGVPLSSELVEEKIPLDCNQTRSEPSYNKNLCLLQPVGLDGNHMIE